VEARSSFEGTITVFSWQTKENNDKYNVDVDDVADVSDVHASSILDPENRGSMYL
jgi:hypothetical protein